jgi:hypothetical protein
VKKLMEAATLLLPWYESPSLPPIAKSTDDDSGSTISWSRLSPVTKRREKRRVVTPSAKEDKRTSEEGARARA